MTCTRIVDELHAVQHAQPQHSGPWRWIKSLIVLFCHTSSLSVSGYRSQSNAARVGSLPHPLRVTPPETPVRMVSFSGSCSLGPVACRRVTALRTFSI